MAKQPDNKGDLEAEVWSAISAFEQILEAIPNDRASLEALSNTYEQIGDHTKAKEYLVRLGDVLLEEKDYDAAALLMDHLKVYAESDPKVRNLVERIGVLSSPAASAEGRAQVVEAAAEKVKAASEKAVRSSFSMADELAFAWNLLEAKELTQEEYASLVQDLTEMSSVESATTVSVLHVLESRAFKNLERVMGHVAKECGTPIISLACFDLKPDVIALLPPDFMVRRGGLIFDMIGKDALAVVMNPYDRQLRKDLEAACGHKCHFYMTLPSEFDKAMEQITKASGKPA